MYKYNPALLKPKDLKKYFIGRGAILDKVVRVLEEGVKRPSNPHFLFIGSRGIGKTHLLLVIYYVIKGEISWNSYKIPEKGWIPLLFAEESYSITTLEDLFFEICKQVQGHISNSRLQSFLKKIEDKVLFNEQFIDQAVSILKEIRDNKKYLLLIDNLHEILEIFDETAQQRLRGILQTYNFFVVIGTATTYFEAIANYEKPFYNFFQTFWLEELGFEEIKELFSRLEGNKREKIKEIEPKIKALTHLTGGNPRLVLSLYEIIKNFGIMGVEKQLTSLLDELTPYMRDVVSQFPPQQRKILEALAINGVPMTPTEIAHLTKLKVTIVTSQLKRLQGHVKVLKEQGRRETLYDIKDKLYALWRQMRLEAGKRRLFFIIRFLEIWYSKKELQEIARMSIRAANEALEKNMADKAILAAEKLYYMAEALHKKDLHLIRVGFYIKFYIKAGDYKKAENEIKRLKQEVKEKEDERLFLRILHIEAFVYYKQNKLKESIKIFKEILSQNREDERAWYFLGFVYVKLKKYEKAIESYENAVKIKPKFYQTWSNLGFCYGKLGKHEKAIECYKNAIKIKPDSHYVWSHLGDAYGTLERYKEATNCYKKSLEIKPDDYWIIYEIGKIYFLKKKFVNAVKYNEKAIKIARDKKDVFFLQILSDMNALLYLILSFRNVKRGNYEKGFEQVERAIYYYDAGTRKKMRREGFVIYLKELLNMKKNEFFVKFVKLVKEKAPEDLKEFLAPYLYALDYLEKKDKMILLRTPQEIREIVQEIYEKLSS